MTSTITNTVATRMAVNAICFFLGLNIAGMTSDNCCIFPPTYRPYPRPKADRCGTKLMNNINNMNVPFLFHLFLGGPLLCTRSCTQCSRCHTTGPYGLCEPAYRKQKSIYTMYIHEVENFGEDFNSAIILSA